MSTSLDGTGQPSARLVPFKVVVCGLPRTGTSSIQAALRLLGIHDVYHWQTTYTNLNDINRWNKAVDAKYHGKGTFTTQDWDELLAAYQATCDAPAALFSVEIAAAYPEAKVVILNRDPESWYQSCMSTIYQAGQDITLWQRALLLIDPSMVKYSRFIVRFQRLAFQFQWPEKSKALEFYERSLRDFREKIAKERILEYRVQDGWGPLCKHLGVDIPQRRVGTELVDMPFPWLNDASAHSAGARKKVRDSILKSIRHVMELAIAFVLGGYLLCGMYQGLCMGEASAET